MTTITTSSGIELETNNIDNARAHAREMAALVVLIGTALLGTAIVVALVIGTIRWWLDQPPPEVQVILQQELLRYNYRRGIYANELADFEEVQP